MFMSNERGSVTVNNIAPHIDANTERWECYSVVDDTFHVHVKRRRGWGWVGECHMLLRLTSVPTREECYGLNRDLLMFRAMLRAGARFAPVHTGASAGTYWSKRR